VRFSAAGSAAASASVAARFVVGPVLALDPAHRAGARAHHHAFRGDLVLAALHTLEQRAVGDAGGGEDDVALGEVLELVDAAQILDAPAGGAAALVVVAEQEAALELAADAAQRGGGEHALRR